MLSYPVAALSNLPAFSAFQDVLPQDSTCALISYPVYRRSPYCDPCRWSPTGWPAYQEMFQIMLGQAAGSTEAPVFSINLLHERSNVNYLFNIKVLRGRHIEVQHRQQRLLVFHLHNPSKHPLDGEDTVSMNVRIARRIGDCSRPPPPPLMVARIGAEAAEVRVAGAELLGQREDEDSCGGGNALRGGRGGGHGGGRRKGRGKGSVEAKEKFGAEEELEGQVEGDAERDVQREVKVEAEAKFSTQGGRTNEKRRKKSLPKTERPEPVGQVSNNSPARRPKRGCPSKSTRDSAMRATDWCFIPKGRERVQKGPVPNIPRNVYTDGNLPLSGHLSLTQCPHLAGRGYPVLLRRRQPLFPLPLVSRCGYSAPPLRSACTCIHASAPPE
ncbi:uncharacterized protein BDZ99DRAFT_483023 [Mytilinidion resinicola]|uniref:Uncharacterized protein n=1 Tax=Mytilinidion resinicola TaxID=574789 RepID=A0A6A6Y152_9PEZI|nr:uncharacterized protein BDZ99DRAFT_483023 [Mytilinidion resinicola]KAF2802288.1 hypothetical protein BDZ99DRAFT_483023 [Mytilinidion resinicola]